MTVLIDVDTAEAEVNRALGCHVDRDVWQYLFRYHLLSLIPSSGQYLLLRDDVLDCTDGFGFLVEWVVKHREILGGLPTDRIIAGDTQIDILAAQPELPSAFYAAAQNLWRRYSHQKPCERLEQIATHSYIGLTRFSTACKEALADINCQLDRYETMQRSHCNQFANSAYYMGSKAGLASFLTEAVSSIRRDDDVILDLMCGSGAASGAFSHLSQTCASDAQQFCQMLAVVHGGGFSLAEAQAALDIVSRHAKSNSDSLRSLVGKWMDAEEEILYSNIGAETVERYRDLYERYPLYPASTNDGAWDPARAVEQRRLAPKTMPYCLATAYFANAYLGLRQCVEVDSIRYGIDQLPSKTAKIWAMAALVTSVSALSLTYAGHFAQPLIRSSESITHSNIYTIVERRAPSILHEFSVRLLSLAEESERAPLSIMTVDGPWHRAIDSAYQRWGSGVTMYVDAPYKRDEYSRYYHVLETLTQYNYPSSVTVARIPDKSTGERFKSEFFTRSSSRMRDAHSGPLIAGLRKGWRCAWSCSNSAAVDIGEVIKEVSAAVPARVKSFSTPYTHKAQGGSKQISVTEFVITFEPY